MDKEDVPRMEVRQVLGRDTFTGLDLSVARIVGGEWRVTMRPGVFASVDGPAQARELPAAESRRTGHIWILHSGTCKGRIFPGGTW